MKIPVIANGDINAQNAKEVLKITACEGLMIGRASVGNPWIFYEIKEGKSVNEALKKRIILTHFEEMIKHYKAMGVSIFRKHLHEYSKGYKDASAFRDMINRIDDANLMRTKIEEFF